MLYGEMPAKNEDKIEISKTVSADLENLFFEFRKYYLNAPWVIDACMQLSLDDALIAWQEIVALLASKESRWFYFAESEEQYIHDVKACIWQCRQYDEWLRSVRIDETKNKLYFLRSGEKSLDTNLLSYLVQKNRMDEVGNLYIFYAFYTDCLTYAFEEYVENTRIFEHDAELFISYCRLAHTCLEKIDSLSQIPFLKNSSWYLDYELAIKKLHEVMALIDDEYGFVQ